MRRSMRLAVEIRTAGAAGGYWADLLFSLWEWGHFIGLCLIIASWKTLMGNKSYRAGERDLD